MFMQLWLQKVSPWWKTDDLVVTKLSYIFTNATYYFLECVIFFFLWILELPMFWEISDRQTAAVFLQVMYLHVPTTGCWNSFSNIRFRQAKFPWWNHEMCHKMGIVAPLMNMSINGSFKTIEFGSQHLKKSKFPGRKL